MMMNKPDLDRLISNASATALVITRGDEIIHRSGELSEDGFRTLMSALQRYWLAGAHQEFNRYVGLRLDNQFHMLFAKLLPQGEDLLGLAFPFQTPLIRVRQDMTNILRSIMARRRKAPESAQPLEQSLQFGYQSTPHPDQCPSLKKETGWRPERDQHINQDEKMPPPADTTHPSNQSVSTDSGSRKRYLTFGAPMQHPIDESLFADRSEEPDVLIEELPWQPLDGDESSQFSRQLPLKGVGEFPDENRHDDIYPLEDNPDLAAILHEDIMPENPGENKPDKDAAPMTAVGRAEECEEEITDVTFYLVPRRDGHHLVGEPSQRLRTWLPAICDKYGWELASLSVRPEYLTWTLRDFPESLISEMLRILRKETSQRIFNLFPEYQASDQGRDVWAPGYLMELGHHEFTMQVLMAHIAESHLQLNE